MKRLLYLECRRILGVLDALKLDAELTQVNATAIGPLLETRVLEQVLAHALVPASRARKPSNENNSSLAFRS